MVPNKYAIRDIPNVTFYDLVTGKARLQLTDLKSSGLENAAETVYAQGGRGNPRIVGFSGDRTGTITLQDAVFTTEALAMMTGNDTVKGVKSIYQRGEAVIANGVGELKHTPVEVISVYTLNPDGTHDEELEAATDSESIGSGEYFISGKTIELESTFNGEVAVYYTVETGSSATTITVSSDKFAGTFKVVMDCLVRDVVTEKDYAAQIVIHKAKMEDNWSIEMAPDGDPSVFDIPLEILKPARGNEMYTMTIYNEDDIV